MPPQALREKQHPAKRSFQALRIAVNDELAAVEEGVNAAIDCLAPRGRLAVISFHSLEDRIVKNVMAQAARGCTCPTAGEMSENPRAHSAKLRVCERLPELTGRGE